MKRWETKWTLVQHSGHGVPALACAVEEAAVTTTVQLKRVQAAGGILFDTYDEASQREYAENYPATVKGLAPRVPGRFSRQVIDGRRIYVPPPDAPHE